MPRVVLWHIPISHYNEKARWALDYKGVEYEGRTTIPGMHMLVSRALTRGRCNTFPVMRVDGKVIGDSTAIIAELERLFPDPPLYPADEAERRRALELEDFFDEELGPHIRLLGYHEITRDPAAVSQLLASGVMGRTPGGPRLAAAVLPRLLDHRFGVSSEPAAERARGKVEAAIERVEAELGDRDYLVGDRFTVADLTAAALFHPAVRPAEGPGIIPFPEPLERYIDQFRGSRAFEWVHEMYRRHRRRAHVAAAA